MVKHTADPKQVRELLRDHEVRVVLEAPEGDYRVEYCTTSTRDTDTGASKHLRTYRLLDMTRGSVTQEPWDRFDLDKQTGLVTNLMDCGGYRILKLVTGWRAQCPACGRISRGKIWEPAPISCGAKGPPRCGYKFTPADIAEEARSAPMSAT
jgi:hypothetical protein